MSFNCPMSGMTMRGFGKQFREETYLKLPPGRDWDGVTKSLAAHTATQKSEWKIFVRKKTIHFQFDRTVLICKSVFLVYINTFLKKKNSVKNSMLLTLGFQVAGPAAVSGASFIF